MAALRSYDYDFRRYKRSDRDNKIRFSITEQAARFVLRDRLLPPLRSSPNRPRANRLACLPYELRLQIYEYVLLLPKSGIMVCPDIVQSELGQPHKEIKYSKALVLLSRDPSAEGRIEDWPAYACFGHLISRSQDKGGRTFTTPLPRLLSLLQVDKETFDVCSKLFYSKNRFHASSLKHWRDLLLDLAPSRASLLRHITLSLHPRDVQFATEMFRKMKKMGVRSVGIGVKKKDWHQVDVRGFRHPNIIRYIDGELAYGLDLRALCGMGRNVSIHVEGDWEGFAKFIRRKSNVHKVTFNGDVVEKE